MKNILRAIAAAVAVGGAVALGILGQTTEKPQAEVHTSKNGIPESLSVHDLTGRASVISETEIHTTDENGNPVNLSVHDLTGNIPAVTCTVETTAGVTVTGRYRIYQCGPGDTMPLCNYNDPGVGDPCDGWNSTFHSFWSVPSPWNSITLTYYVARCGGGWSYLGSWTVQQPPRRCDYSFVNNTIEFTSPDCRHRGDPFLPNATCSPPLPTPTPTPIPSPTPGPSPTPLSCIQGNFYCPPQWVYYGGCGWYWTSGICCPAGWTCQTTFSWSTECLISNCCTTINGQWTCLQ